MSTYKVSTKSGDTMFLDARSYNQALISAQHVHGDENVDVVEEASDDDIRRLLNAHSLPQDEE